MSKKTLYNHIFKDFEKLIKTGQLKPADKLPTEMQISEKYNVSRITVIRALKELESQNYIYRIKGSGSYVTDAKCNTEGNSLENPLSLISLVLPFSQAFSSKILQGVEDVAKQKNFFVTFHNSQNNPDIEREIIEEIISRGSQGIIVYPTSAFENVDLYTTLLIDNYPLVLIDRKIYGVDMTLIGSDNQKCFYDITSYLISLGHKRIIFAGSSVFTTSSELERYNGYCKAHIDNKIPLMKKHLFSDSDLKDLPDGFLKELPIEKREAHYLFTILENIPKKIRPTAIAAVNDQIAKILLTVALERGLKIPQDYSITGFDDEAFAAHLAVPLTTIAQPTRTIGEIAADELFKTIINPERTPTTRVVEGNLIIRSSTEEVNYEKEIK